MGSLNVEVGPRPAKTPTASRERTVIRFALYAVVALSLASLVGYPFVYIVGGFKPTEFVYDQTRAAWIALSVALAGLAASTPRP